MNIKVLGISGSIRKNSFNSGLLRAAKEVQPENMDITIYDIAELPLYNEDNNVGEPPKPVQDFKRKIAEVDAILFAVTEYNYSLSGVLKNAIDWASRPLKDSPLNGKPFAMMGAGGGLGTARAQYHLRQIAVFVNMFTFNKPELMIPRAFEKFDENGNLKDDSIKEKIKDLLDAFYNFTLGIKKST
jgi:chromate reductase, NAD(P)H dehydrogenase (quinone)